jgi:putative aldouronate transport system permease protein
MVAAEEKQLQQSTGRFGGGRVRHSGGDRLFYIVDAVLLTAIFLVVLYPLVFIISASFSDAQELTMGRVWLWPVKPSLEGYKAVFGHDDVWIGYGNTIFYTFFGTILNVVMTMIVAYPLSRKDFVGRNIVMFLFTFTMFFNGGLIPTYLLIKSLGLVDTRAVMIVPWAIGVWNVIITRTYLASNIPEELYDSARVDGASNTRMLLMIVIPLSGPIIAVITLFYAVNHWNQFFNALIYLRSRSLRPLQLVLREILVQNSPVVMDEMMAGMSEDQLDLMMQREFLQQLLQYALIIVATLPVLVMYPFVQKYFVRGIMIGAIKG